MKPSLMQLNCSYVITDPKGTLIGETGKLLKRGAPKRDKTGKPIRGKDGKIIYQPYVIKVLNTNKFIEKSSLQSVCLYQIREGYSETGDSYHGEYER